MDNINSKARRIQRLLNRIKRLERGAYPQLSEFTRQRGIARAQGQIKRLGGAA